MYPQKKIWQTLKEQNDGVALCTWHQLSWFELVTFGDPDFDRSELAAKTLSPHRSACRSCQAGQNPWKISLQKLPWQKKPSLSQEIVSLLPPATFDDDMWMANCLKINSMSRFASEFLGSAQQGGVQQVVGWVCRWKWG